MASKKKKKPRPRPGYLILTALTLLLASCAGLSEQAIEGLDGLDLNTAEITKVLADAPKVQLIVDMSDLNRNGRLDGANEGFALLSAVVALAMTAEPDPVPAAAAPPGEP